MLLPPYPSPPDPLTYLPGQQFLTSNLRADLTNAALLFANRPIFAGSQTFTSQPITGTSTPVELDTETVDSWQVHAPPAANVACRFPGWYLIDGYNETTSISNANWLQSGIRATVNGTTTNAYAGTGPGNGTNDQGYGAATLVQLDPATGDRWSLQALASASCSIVAANAKAEWVGLPTTSSTGWPTGQVITNPQAAAPLAPGTGTTIANVGGIPVAATSVQVASASGIFVGSVLGLDYYLGQQVSPMAEMVTVTSVSGTTIGITATSYPHGSIYSPGAVAVPISAAWYNKQARDLINFLAYPPMAHVYASSSIPIGAQTFPAGSSVELDTAVADNFGGFTPGLFSSYNFPVSGEYYVFGCVMSAGVFTGTTVAGLGLSGQPVQWGTAVNSPNGGGVPVGATVRRHLRVVAGQSVQLFVSQNSSGIFPTGTGFSNGCRLIVLFRAF